MHQKRLANRLDLSAGCLNKIVAATSLASVVDVLMPSKKEHTLVRICLQANGKLFVGIVISLL